MHKSETAAQVGVERTPKRKNRKKLDRLTRDAIAAQEAGMSYGKWKAQNPHTLDEDEDQEPQIEPGAAVAVCEYCGGKFVKTMKTKRFCSATCQSGHNAKKKAEKDRQKAVGRSAVCPVCGADFVATHHSRIYCSPECYADSMRNRATERWKQHSENIKKEAAENGSN